MTEPSNVCIRNDTEVSIYFPHFFPDGIPAGTMIQLEGYPFATVNPALSVEKAAERESWCILNAREFFLKQTTSAPGLAWTLFHEEMKDETKKEWEPTFDHLSYTRNKNLQGSELTEAKAAFLTALNHDVNKAWLPNGTMDAERLTTCITISKTALKEAKISNERRLFIEETRLLMQFRIDAGGDDPLIRLSAQDLTERRLKQEELETLQLALDIAEYQSELDDKYIAKIAQAALMDTKIEELKSKIAAIQGEGSRTVTAGGGGTSHGSSSSASAIGLGGAGRTPASTSLIPWNPLKIIGDKDERIWHVAEYKLALEAISNGYFRNRAVSVAILAEVTSLTGDLLIHFDAVRAMAFHMSAADSHLTSFGRPPVFALVGDPCIHSVARALKLPVMKSGDLLTRWYNGALVELHHFSTSTEPMIKWEAETVFQSVRNIQLLLTFWGTHFENILDDLLENIMDKDVTARAPLPWLISLIQNRFVEYNTILRTPMYTAELASRPGYPANLKTCANTAQLLHVTMQDLKTQALSVQHMLVWQQEYKGAIIPVKATLVLHTPPGPPALPPSPLPVAGGADGTPRIKKRPASPTSIEEYRNQATDMRARIVALEDGIREGRGGASGGDKRGEPMTAEKRRLLVKELRKLRQNKHHICVYNACFLTNVDTHDCRNREVTCFLTHFDDLSEISRRRLVTEWSNCQGFRNGTLPVDILSGPKQIKVLAALTQA